jgi:uncharacterized protein YuzE
LMIIYYDSSVDALDIRLLPEAEVSRSIDVDQQRVVDLDASGRVVSIEVMAASEGFEIDDLINRFELSEHRDDLRKLAEGKLPVAPR